MEKRNYVKPILNSEAFVPQTYVAACGDESVTWSIKCNVPYGTGFIDNNNNNKYDYRTDTYLAQGSGCGVYHKGVTLPKGETPQQNAKWVDSNGKVQGVFFWKTNNSNNGHHFSLVEEGDWHKENLS